MFNRTLLFLKRNILKSSILLLLTIVIGTLLFATTYATMGISKIMEDSAKTTSPSISVVANYDSDVNVIKSLSDQEIMKIESSKYWLKTVNKIDLLFKVDDMDKVKPFTPKVIDSEIKVDDTNVDNLLNITGTNSTDFLTSSEGYQFNYNFSEKELESKDNIIILNDEYMKSNNLQIGDTLTISVLASDKGTNDENLIWNEFEIIGDYNFKPSALDIDQAQTMALEDDNVNPNDYISGGYNKAFIPITTAEDLQNKTRESFLNLNGLETIERNSKLFYEYSNLYSVNESKFYYKNKSEYDSFSTDINKVVKTRSDLITKDDSLEKRSEYGFLNLIAEYSGLILSGVTISSALFLSLIIMLFIRDRRIEIGVLISLGEKKVTILMQLILELLILTSIGFTCAIPIGYCIANSFSGLNSGPFIMQLDIAFICIYYSIGCVIVVLSSIIPLIYIFRLRPNKILL